MIRYRMDEAPRTGIPDTASRSGEVLAVNVPLIVAGAIAILGAAIHGVGASSS
jgi:hypothetical protein